MSLFGKHQAREYSHDEMYSLIPSSAKAMEIVIMVGAFMYQFFLLNQVARDFIAVNNTPLRVGFLGLSLCLVVATDVMVYRTIINIVHVTWKTIGVLFFIGLFLSGIFILEIGRLNVAQNGIPLASRTTNEFRSSIAKGLKKVEQAMNTTAAELTEDIAVLDAAITAEQQGVVRPEIEERIKQRFGITFHFTGKVGSSIGVSTIKNIREQKASQLLAFQSATKQDAAEVAAINQDMIEMASTQLTPENYNNFVLRQAKIASRLRALAAQYGVDDDFNTAPARSLLVIAVDSAFEGTTTNLVLWLIAIGTGYGSFLIVMFINALALEHALLNNRTREDMKSSARIEAEEEKEFVLKDAKKDADVIRQQGNADAADYIREQERITRAMSEQLVEQQAKLDREFASQRHGIQLLSEEAERNAVNAREEIITARARAERITAAADDYAAKVRQQADDDVASVFRRAAQS